MFVSFPLMGKINGNVLKKYQKRCEERKGDLKKREHEQRLENKQTERREEERKGDKKKGYK